jgi:hypothetical protein
MTRPTLPLILLLAACAVPPPAHGPAVVELHAPAWIADASSGWDAAAHPAVLRAAGRAPLGKDRDVAARQAEAVATGLLTARLVEAAAQLRRTYVDLHESQLSPAARDELTASDDAARAAIAQAISGAHLIGQWADDESFWAWLEVDAAATLLPAVQDELSAHLVPLARELTPADRQALSDELDAFVAGHHGR